MTGGWRPGSGRPKGARNKFSRRVVEDLLRDWEEGGPGAIKRMRVMDPSGYVKVCASLLPRELTVETALADLSDDDIDDLIEQIKQHMIEARRPILISRRDHYQWT